MTPTVPRAGRQRADGFSLVEIIMAVSLLSLVMVMMFNLYPTSLVTIRQAEHRVTATACGQRVLEQERVLSFAQLLANVGGPTAVPATASGVVTGEDGVQYLSYLTIKPKTPSLFPTPHLLIVTVDEYWNERNDNPDPTKYLTWHHLAAETYLVDLKQ